MYETSGDRDQTACFAASDLGLHCLPITHIKDAGLYILSVRLHATMVYILQTFVGVNWRIICMSYRSPLEL